MNDFFQLHTSDQRNYTTVVPLEWSKPEIPVEELLKATEMLEPFPFDDQTDISVGGALHDFIDGFLNMIPFL